MDLIDQIQSLAAKIQKQLPAIETEEATKTAFILPFIQLLGYDIFNPMEVIPEFNADVGIKKGEKVDYAITQDGEPIMLIECKSCKTNLDEIHASQLYRYFSVTRARIGILTNGVTYRFFTDLDEPNKMDERPFLEFNILEVDETLIPEIKKFTKSGFDLESAVNAASDLKYTREIKRVLAKEVSSPSDEFIRFLVKRVYTKPITQAVKEQFSTIVQRAVNQFINEKINERLKSALVATDPIEASSDHSEENDNEQDEIVTTEEELEGFYIVRAILRESIDPARVAMRDRKSYCGILLDDNNRKPICRLHFNRAQKYLGTFEPDGDDRKETRHPIADLSEIYKFADQIKGIVAYYDGKTTPEGAA